ncbi:hypothetical protein AX16_001336 [Volvariella volvacea WC 439]|nr:hypothetical protein AX16_001336 [Volvariella volvacea WC 439]
MPLGTEEKRFWDRHLPSYQFEEPETAGCGSIPVHNGFVFHGKTLPIELLEEIFQEYIEDTPSTEIRSVHLNLTSLAHICHHWRTILLSQPKFWSRICLDHLSPSLILLVELWLIRSGSTTPLKISLNFTRANDDKLNPQIMSLLVGEAHRWRSIDFYFKGEHPPDAFHNMEKGSAPVLQDVRLEAESWPQESLTRIWVALGSSPSLRTARISHLPSMSPSLLPWHQLVSLRVPEGVQCQTLFSILKDCPRLEELMLRYPKGNMEQMTDTITLPRLKCLWFLVKRGTPQVITKLIAPMLETFILSFPSGIGDHTEQLSHTDDFLQRSKCSLLSLRIHGAFRRTRADPLIPFLRSPNLVHLKRINLARLRTDSAEKLLRFLTVPPFGEDEKPAILWPSLNKVVLNLLDRKQELVDGLVGEMLASRKSKLKEVCIHVSRAQHGFVRDKEVVDELRKSGLHIDHVVV